MGPSLHSILETKIDITSPVFEDKNRPGVVSCLQVVETEFLLNHPIQSRRFQFLSLKQAGNESFSEFLAKLKLHGTHVKLETLGMEGLYIYCAIVGLNSAHLELKEKLLELKDLTLPEMDRIARSLESAQSTIKKMKDTVVVVNRVRNDFYDNDSPVGYDDDSPLAYKNNVKGRTPQERLEWLRRRDRCLRCGRHDESEECWSKSAQCHLCGRIGHLQYLCLDPNSDASSSSDSGDAEGEDDDKEYAKTRATFQGHEK